MCPHRTGPITLALALAPLASPAGAADAPAKVTYQDQVAPIFRNRCNTCHNADKQKGGLTLETFAGAMQGGGSGKVVEPGDPDSSTLFQLVTHKDEPKMPPNSPKIPDAEIDTLKRWIEGGALESSGSVAAAKAKPKFELKLDPSSAGRPVGPPAMPENLSTEPFVVSPRPGAVVAMAASPWAPLVAVGGHKQVLLYRTTDHHLAGVLPFPEGSIFALRFSRNGSLLLAGGGRGGQSGLAVAWDVKTGKRVFELGQDKEYDVVLAADLSPDHGQVALGGPGKVVRVYNTADGAVQYELRKHTEWITALEFSPDGVLLATGDRNNGLLVWEAQTGREFFDLRGHNASITDVSWRSDSNVLASASEDGSVKLWEMENGTPFKSFGAHGGGIASVRFGSDGRLVTAGRDRLVRLWDGAGNKQRDLEPFGDLALEAVFSHDGSRVVAGDWSGEVRVWDAATGNRLANLAANPAPVARRLELARKALDESQAQAELARKALAPVQVARDLATAAHQSAVRALASGAAEAKRAKDTADALDRALQAKLSEMKAAAEAQSAAEEKVKTARADRLAAEKAVGETTDRARAAADALTAARREIGAALARKTEQDKTFLTAVTAVQSAADRVAADRAASELARQAMRATERAVAVGLAGANQASAQAFWEEASAAKSGAPAALKAAGARLQTAEAAAHSAREQVEVLSTARDAAARALETARAGQMTAETLGATKKADLARAEIARASAEKVYADRKVAAEVAAAVVAARNSEVNALLAEARRPAPAGTSTSPQPGVP